MTRTKEYRPAFTLIELLVATGIIAMLLGLVAISFPRFNEREQLTRAVDKLRTGLLTARLWAKRDQVMTGIKFLKNTNNQYYGYQFVQQPIAPATGKVSGNYIYSGDPGATSITAMLNPNLSTIFKDDFLIISGDVPHKITNNPGTASPTTISLGSELKFDVFDKTDFRIIHAPIVIPMQEDVIFQPDSPNDPASNAATIYIDSTIANLTNDSVLFLPTGNVINQGSGTIKFTINQVLPDPNASNETSDIFLDCMSGTNRYISPN